MTKLTAYIRNSNKKITTFILIMHAEVKRLLAYRNYLKPENLGGRVDSFLIKGGEELDLKMVRDLVIALTDVVLKKKKVFMQWDDSTLVFNFIEVER